MLHLCTKIAPFMHITVQQATEQYKVSIRTLRTLIAGLTDQQRTKYLLIKGKQHLISTELLNQHYQPRTGEQVQNKGAKMQTHNTSPSDAPPTDTASDAKQVQTELIAHLKNEVAQLHSRLQESTYIIANLTKQLPAPATTDRHTGTETEHHNRRAVYLVCGRLDIWFSSYWFSSCL
jgi:hypothetical protein